MFSWLWQWWDGASGFLAITSPGIEYTAPAHRLHYTAAEQMHFTAQGRLHYTATE